MESTEFDAAEGLGASWDGASSLDAAIFSSDHADSEQTDHGAEPVADIDAGVAGDEPGGGPVAFADVAAPEEEPSESTDGQVPDAAGAGSAAGGGGGAGAGGASAGDGAAGGGDAAGAGDGAAGGGGALGAGDGAAGAGGASSGGNAVGGADSGAVGGTDSSVAGAGGVAGSIVPDAAGAGASDASDENGQPPLGCIDPRGGTPDPVQASYYVDPSSGSDKNDGLSLTTAFKTLEKARWTVRTVNRSMTGDIIVYLTGGVHTLTGTLEFSEADSGTGGHRVIYSRCSAGTPILSGGRTITGWSSFDAKKNIYRAPLEAGTRFRQLYVNGVRAIRARSLSGIPGTVSDQSYGYWTDDQSMLSWSDTTSSLEFVYDVAIFTRQRLLVASMEPSANGTKITMAEPWWTTVQHPTSKAVLYAENAYELIDQEAEWYLDEAGATLYYKPRAGEDMSTALVIAPILEKLVEVRGALNDRAHSMRFHGLQFSYATYNVPTDRGHLELQANMILPDAVPAHSQLWKAFTPRPDPANVTVEAARDIVFSNCTFEALGSTGLDFVYTQSCAVHDSTFTDISGNGINVLGYVSEPVLDDPNKITRSTYIYNNRITNVASEYRGGLGVFVGYTEDTAIDHNEIADLPYTGISLGWGWGVSNYSEALGMDVKVRYNHIHHVMQDLADGAGIYSLGDSPNTVIQGNYVSDQRNEFAAYYLDDGSAHIVLNQNVCANVPSYIVAKGHDVYWDSIYTTTSSGRWNVTNATSLPATVYASPVPVQAQAIIDTAGVLPSYEPASRDLVDGWRFYNDNTTGAGDPNFDRFEYQGTWQNQFGTSGFSGGTLRQSKNANDSASFRFHGKLIEWRSTKSPDYGMGAVSIDGGAETQIDLYSPVRLDSQSVWRSPELPSGEHTLTIRVTGNRNSNSSDTWVVVDGVQVYEGQDLGGPRYYNDDTAGSPENSGQLGYSTDARSGESDWQRENSGSRGTTTYSKKVDANVLFKFTGTRIDWHSPKSDHFGIGMVSVDNGPETAVDLYDPTSLPDQLVWSSPNLASGVHTIRIRVSGDKNPSSSDSYVVVDGLGVVDLGSHDPVKINENATGSGENQFAYVGSWRSEDSSDCSEGTVRSSQNAGDQVVLKFRGTQIRWFGVRSAMSGKAAVSVLNADGLTAIGPETIIDPYTDIGLGVCGQLLWTSPVLPNGEYQLRIRVTGKRHPDSLGTAVFVDGVAVTP